MNLGEAYSDSKSGKLSKLEAFPNYGYGAED